MNASTTDDRQGRGQPPNYLPASQDEPPAPARTSPLHPLLLALAARYPGPVDITDEGLILYYPTPKPVPP